MDPDRAAWLAQTVEEPLEPELPIVDSHHHFWSRAGDEYLLDEFRADTGAGHNVVQTVFVECGEQVRTAGPPELRPVGETTWVASMAEESERTAGAMVAGIVGYSDLRLGPDAVRRSLDAHIDAAGGRFVGIRHATAWDASPNVFDHRTEPTAELLRDDTFRASAKVLAALGLAFDSFIYHPQIPELTELAQMFPDMPVVLNHTGAPLGVGPYAGKRYEVLADLTRSLAAFAVCPNAYVKLGGIGMPWFGNGWHELDRPPGSEAIAELWGPMFRRCVELFGPDRCMFESNFPVDRRSMSYVVAWNAYKRITADLSASERADLFAGTARRVYGLAGGPSDQRSRAVGAVL